MFEVHGFDQRVVQTASKDLGLEKWQEGFQGPWIWGWVRPKINGKNQ